MRARLGDLAAFVELVGTHDPRMRQLAYRLLADAEAMGEALAGAYATAHRSLGQARAQRDPAAWLFRITYNACVDVLSREPASSGEIETTGDLRSALAALPPGQRVALVLVDGEGLPEPEVAAILGLTPERIASRLRRARATVGHAVAPSTSDLDVAGALQELVVPDHPAEFWPALEARLVLEVDQQPPDPTQAVAAPQPLPDADERPPRHLVPDLTSALLPASVRRMSNLLLLVLVIAAAVLVVVSGLTLVRNRSDAGLRPADAGESAAAIGPSGARIRAV